MSRTVAALLVVLATGLPQQAARLRPRDVDALPSKPAEGVRQ